MVNNKLISEVVDSSSQKGMKENNLYFPVVSIIVATYRRDVSLERALLSLVNQKYKYLEVIIVDDNASLDWNRKVEHIVNEIRSKFSFAKLIYIKNDKNFGSASTRNIGIEKATGEYITFLDDDDIYLPGKVENQLYHMIEYNSDYSITDLYLYDEHNRLVDKRNRKYLLLDYNKNELLRYHLMYHMTGTDTIMFKKEYLVAIGGFPLINVGDEFYLMERAINNGGIFSYLPKCDVKAYIHTDTDGLSSGDSKINGENALYDYKKTFFKMLNKQEIKYIKMRHYAVLAFAEFRKRKYYNFFRYATYSFYNSPFKSIELFFERRSR